MSPFRSSLRPFTPGLRRLAYATAAMPTIAFGAGLVQGIAVLIDYRQHHRDAPEPVNPASGVVAVTSHKESETQTDATDSGFSLARLLRRWTATHARASNGSTTTNNHSSTLQSMSGTSKQPLRLLVVGDSLAVGVGTKSSATPILPEAISRSLSAALAGRAVQWTCLGTSGAAAGRIVRDIEAYHESKVGSNDDEREQPWPRARRRIRAWLDQDHTSNGDSATNKRVKQWLRRRADARNWLKDDDETELWKNWRGSIKHKSRDPDKFQEYDVAVVLTGLNDVKDSALPFLASYSKEEKQARQKDQHGSEGYEGQLKRILTVLKNKMNGSKNEIGAETEESGSVDASNEPCPLIVLPGLPATIVPAFHLMPLGWFLLPLIRGVDRQKRNISRMYQRSVLFVESPATAEVSEYEDRLEPVQSKRNGEQVVLDIHDISAKAKHKVEEAMARYYELKEKISKREANERDTERQYEQSYHQHGSASRPITLNPPVGSKLFSADGIHPNDEGYDYYGRHIAKSVIARWEECDKEEETRLKMKSTM